jgi:hypothetical protein
LQRAKIEGEDEDEDDNREQRNSRKRNSPIDKQYEEMLLHIKFDRTLRVMDITTPVQEIEHLTALCHGAKTAEE